ncbi:MAG: glutamine--fructose-6-phosphate transaminase (isomerizing) [Alphaproteobacteria bacterium]
MCGIIGVIGSSNAKDIILTGLKKLEYRGYDSSGIAFYEEKKFNIIKEEGKIIKLENSLKKRPINSSMAIGHTRWATHGIPSKENAHPHASSKVVVVHNGIIENYQDLRNDLVKSGVKFISQTDTEVLPHLIEQYYLQHGDILKSLIATSKELVGTYAIATMFKDRDDVIGVAKKGSPIVIGIGDNENYIASDFYGLADITNQIIFLDDNEFALIFKNQIQIFDANGNEVRKIAKIIETQKNRISKNGYDHFMLKEIHEQPLVLEETIQTYLDLANNKINLPNFNFDLRTINKITIIACGTSYYAGMIAKYLIEHIAGVEVEVDIASEFRYRNTPFREDNLMIFVSQSGETADTLASLKYAKANNQKILSIVNVAHSSMAQLSDAVIRTLAGPEIGVASTKAYTAQIAVLAIFTIYLARLKNRIDDQKQSNYLQEITRASSKMNQMFDDAEIRNIKKIASKLTNTKQLLYIGRSISFVTALESALKFRELTYINAQGISAGELKHGTIAVIDKKMPVIVIGVRNKDNDIFDKTISNAQEVNARGGKIIFVSDKKGINIFGKLAKYKIEIPEISGSIQEALLPIIPLQLLSYYVAHFKGNDVDQPRNLAKSVTVE